VAPERSQPRSQKPVTGPCPQANECSPYSTNVPYKDPFWNYSPTYMSVMQRVSMISKPNLVRNSHFSHASQMSRPCEPPRCHIPAIRDESKYEVLHYTVFSKLLSIPPSYTQIFSSEPPVVRLKMSWPIHLLLLYNFKAQTLPISYPVLRQSTDSLDI
jgi:hypothetical protein